MEGARDGISGSLGLGTTINSATPSMVQVQFVLVQKYGAHQVWWGLVFAEDTLMALGVPSRVTILYIRTATAINCPLSRAPFTSLASYKIVTERKCKI